MLNENLYEKLLNADDEETTEICKRVQDERVPLSQDTFKYLAGYIAFVFKDKYPELHEQPEEKPPKSPSKRSKTTDEDKTPNDLSWIGIIIKIHYQGGVRFAHLRN